MLLVPESAACTGHYAKKHTALQTSQNFHLHTTVYLKVIFFSTVYCKIASEIASLYAVLKPEDI